MIRRGFNFGMILQLAVGPISLFILQVSLTSGTYQGLQGVAGVTLVDGLFIAAAILGTGGLIENNPSLKKYMRYFGGGIFLLFGASSILSVFDYNILPSLSFSMKTEPSIFLKAIIMTAANPLTIIFWAGVFSSKISEYNMTSQMMWLFGIGAVLSTLICMTVLALVGSCLSIVVNRTILVFLNLIVGGVLIGFGCKMIIRV